MKKKVNVLFNEFKSDTKRGKLLRTCAIVFALLIVSCCLVLSWYLHEKSVNTWQLKSETITVEYGTVFEPSIQDFVDTTTYPNVHNGNTHIELPDVNDKGILPLGEYNVKISHESGYMLFNKTIFNRSDEKTCLVEVIDTVAPKWEECPLEVECIKDCKEDFTEKYKASDLSVVDIVIDDKVVDYSTEGEYDAVVFATDEGGNVINQAITVKVLSPTIELSEKELVINIGSKANIEASVTGKEQEVVWASDDESIATVSDGVVVGVKAGTTTVTATANGVKSACEVVVKEKTTSTSRSSSSSNDNYSSSTTSRTSNTSNGSNNNSSSSRGSSSSSSTPTCANGNHSIGCGNVGRWFNSRNEFVNYYNTTTQEWANKVNNGSISWEEYYSKCPSGYECWSCSNCGKWSGNFKYIN